jgi:hypothetical protein
LRKEGETVLTAELLGLMIAWLLAAIVLSLLLWMLVLIWGQMLHTMKTWFGMSWFGMSREPLSRPQEHEQVVYPPLSQDGYVRRD